MKTTEGTIEKYLFSFGFLPLLLVMEVFQQGEKYEWCAIILKVLRKYSDKYGFNIPEKYNKDAIEEMKYNFWKYHNLSGDVAEKNTPYYAAEIYNDILEYESNIYSKMD